MDRIALPSRERAARGPRVAMLIYAAVTAIFFATAQPGLFDAHTSYNHFALLAEGWLDGRLDLGGPPPAYTGNNDFALFEGKHYVSFPPFPAVLIAPVVAMAGGAEKVRDGAFFLWFAGAAPALLFLTLEKLAARGRSRRSLLENAAFSLLFALGTVYFFSSVQGTVWFAAHVVGTSLGCAYLLLSVGAERPFLAGLALGLGFATRTPLVFALPFFLHEAWLSASLVDPSRGPRIGRASLSHLAKKLALFALPSAAVLALLLAHNAARFGDPFEFGHALLTVAWRARIDKWGLFSYHYLGRNLAIVLAGLPFVGPGDAPLQINGHGLALWITTPLYAWALWPRRANATYVALALTALAVAAPSLLYQNSGWIQFGYRFSNDFAPMLFVMIAVGGRRLSPAFWVAALASVAINTFGACTFQRSGYESRYFLDRTQRVIQQPD